ncbi:MAG: hypothetical protein AB4206_14965 [Xenococcaceae cyanobacterium]
MSPLTSIKTPHKASRGTPVTAKTVISRRCKGELVSSEQIKAILKDQLQLSCLCIKKISLKEFLSFQGWLSNTTDFLSPQWLLGLKKQKQERARLEWSNSLAIARLKSMVEQKRET